MSDMFPSGWWIPPTIVAVLVCLVVFGLGYCAGGM